MPPVTSLPHPLNKFVRDRLAMAVRFLAPNQVLCPLQTVAIGIQEIVNAAYVCEANGTNLATSEPAAAAAAAGLLGASAARVSVAVNGKIPPECIYLALGATIGLLTNSDDPYRADRINYAAMLSAELSILHHSEALAVRGFPFLRAIHAQRREPGALVH